MKYIKESSSLTENSASELFSQHLPFFPGIFPRAISYGKQRGLLAFCDLKKRDSFSLPIVGFSKLLFRYSNSLTHHSSSTNSTNI